MIDSSETVKLQNMLIECFLICKRLKEGKYNNSLDFINDNRNLVLYENILLDYGFIDRIFSDKYII